MQKTSAWCWMALKMLTEQFEMMEVSETGAALAKSSIQWHFWYYLLNIILQLIWSRSSPTPSPSSYSYVTSEAFYFKKCHIARTSVRWHASAIWYWPWCHMATHSKVNIWCRMSLITSSAPYNAIRLNDTCQVPRGTISRIMRRR